MGTDQRREAWQNLLHYWGVAPLQADRTFETLVQAYSAPGRFYHTLDHVMEVLATVENLASHARNPSVVKLAAWLHDVIYDSKASDNEERSARYAEMLCEELTIPEGPRVAALIRKTKTHIAADDADAQVLIDADLAILGASQPDYRDYAKKIRLEYAWVPEPQYRQGRRRVLESFLSRPRIYHFLGQLEEPARRNLAAELARLEVEIEDGDVQGAHRV
jgi:predicted metal-dependent HD superfamily phosphohydrolase